MKRFAALLRLNLKYYVIPSFDDKKSKGRYIALIAVMCVALLAPLVFICMTLWSAAQIMLAAGMGVQMLAAVFTMVQIIVIVLSVVTYITSMFFAKDNEILLNMPLRGAEIFSAKFVCTYINELVVSAATVIPVAVITAIAGIQAGYADMFGAAYWILIPFAILLLPAMPLLILSVISFPIAMIVQRLSKRPVLSAVLQAVLVMGFVGACYYFAYSGSMTAGSEDGQFDPGMFESVGGISYYTMFLAKAMLGISSAGNFFAFVGITAAMAAAALGLSVLLYRRAIVMSVDGGSVDKKRAKTHEQKSRGTLGALIYAHVKSLLRTPDILVNLLMTMFMPALMAVIMSFVMPTAAEIAAQDPDSAEAFVYFGYFPVGMIMWVVMFSSPISNIGASYAFSLDKDNFAVLKSMPVSGKDVFRSKLIVSDAISVASVLIVLVAMIFMTDVPFYGYIILPLCLGVYLVSCNAFTMSRDLARPNFRWMNVKELTKTSNSGTQFIMMGVGMTFGLVAAMPMFVISFVGGKLPEYAVELIVWGAAALSCLSSYPILRLTSFRGVEEKYARIDG